MFCDGALSNLWSIKSILRWFEMVSGLKVNLSKSKIFSLNLDDEFITAASTFLSCGVWSLAFTFLEVGVEINLRKKLSWKNTVNKIQRRLSCQKSKFMSQWGRITMINIVLTNIHIYPFSFYREPKAIIKEIIIFNEYFFGVEMKVKGKCVRLVGIRFVGARMMKD